MRREISVLFGLLLLFGFTPEAPGQEAGGAAGTSGQQEDVFRLDQNYPNPFNPETRIPFEIRAGAFVEDRPAVVTLRVYNVLLQHVATPTALGHSMGEGVPVQDLEYRFPGRYEAYWDGKDRSGAEVASGVYVLQLVVNGRQAIRKMFVTK